MAEEIIQIKPSIYGFGRGHFSSYPQPKYSIRWMSCREGFARRWTNKVKTFLFCTGSAEATKQLPEFVSILEDRLGLEDKTVITRTNRDAVVMIKVPSFWYDNSMHRSFFTMILRAGVNYIGNFEEALFSTQYTKQTRKAVERFMSGATKYTGKKGTGGWVNRFAGYYRYYGCYGQCRRSGSPSDKKINELLVFP